MPWLVVCSRRAQSCWRRLLVRASPRRSSAWWSGRTSRCAAAPGRAAVEHHGPARGSRRGLGPAAAVAPAPAGCPGLRVVVEEAAGQRHALDLVAQQPDLRDRPGGRGQLRALGRRAARRARRRGALEERPSASRSPVVSAGRLGRSGVARAARADPGLDVGLGRGGPAGVQAVALALELRAAHQLARQLRRGRSWAEPAEGPAGVHHPVDLGRIAG